MYCTNQWVLLCWRDVESQDCQSADLAPLCPVSQLCAQPAVLSGNYASGIYVAVSKDFYSVVLYPINSED